MGHLRGLLSSSPGFAAAARAGAAYSVTVHRAWVIVAATLAAPGLAHAEMWDGLDRLILAGELVVPDVRFEASFTGADEGDTRWVLSWPLVVHVGELGTTAGLSVNLFGEGQYQYGRGAVRGVVGGRALVFTREDGADERSPLFEAGAVIGGDGYGGMIGVGYGINARREGTSLGVVVRAVVTGDEVRGDIALDVHLPLISPGT